MRAREALPVLQQLQSNPISLVFMLLVVVPRCATCLALYSARFCVTARPMDDDADHHISVSSIFLLRVSACKNEYEIVHLLPGFLVIA